MIWVKLYEDFSEIDALCQKWGIENYTINPDGTVDVNDDVYLRDRGLKVLPLKFGRVSGSFDCCHNQLTTLEGAPREVGGGFYCSYNKLTTFKCIPEKVGSHFNFYSNKLTTLEGAPSKVSGSFDCGYNNLTTLEGAPKEVSGSFNCSWNNLTTLEGAPKEVGGYFSCSNNQLTTLEGATREVGDNFYYENNPLPNEILTFNDPKYIVKWQDDYGIWQSGKLNQFRWQQMINDYDLG